MEKMYDVAVLGGGPGGYVAAVRASRQGQKTVMEAAHDIDGLSSHLHY